MDLRTLALDFAGAYEPSSKIKAKVQLANGSSQTNVRLVHEVNEWEEFSMP